jgi:uncharacterized protein DUF5655
VKGHECFHCKQWIPAGVEHDCWTTTEQALTRDLSEDLRDAWERLRETAAEFGEQRIYASHHSIMFSRKSCYFFVRPQRKRLEVVFWLGRNVVAPEIRKSLKTSKVKHAHVVHLVHRDQVETPLTDWLREAYALQDTPPPAQAGGKTTVRSKPVKKKRTSTKTGAPGSDRSASHAVREARRQTKRPPQGSRRRRRAS